MNTDQPSLPPSPAHLPPSPRRKRDRNAAPRSIANYTTEVEVDQTIAEISLLLRRAKAVSIITEFGENGQHASVGFRLRVGSAEGLATFRLRANPEGVWRVLKKSEISQKLQTEEQANRVAWRMLRHWLEQSLARIEAGEVEPAEAFLAYLQNPQTGLTLYEQLKDSQFKGLLLTEGGKEA
jgi:hypothetical protein